VGVAKMSIEGECNSNVERMNYRELFPQQ